jgi:hypothetical protein
MASNHRLQVERTILSAKPLLSSNSFQETKMSDSDLRKEIAHQPAEPLLPIEKKLIIVSLVTGLVLLAVLVGINFFLGR